MGGVSAATTWMVPPLSRVLTNTMMSAIDAVDGSSAGHESAIDVGAVRAPNDSEEPDHINVYDRRSRYLEVSFSSSWH